MVQGCVRSLLRSTWECACMAQGPGAVKDSSARRERRGRGTRAGAGGESEEQGREGEGATGKKGGVGLGWLEGQKKKEAGRTAR